MLTSMGTRQPVRMRTRLRKPRRSKKKGNTKIKERVCEDETIYIYAASNNNKNTPSEQNTESLINFDNDRCVFSTFVYISVRYSLICKVRGFMWFLLPRWPLKLGFLLLLPFFFAAVIPLFIEWGSSHSFSFSVDVARQLAALVHSSRKEVKLNLISFSKPFGVLGSSNVHLAYRARSVLRS